MTEELVISRNIQIKGSIGFLIGQMDDVRNLLLKEIEGLTQEVIDFTPNIHKIETIGTLLFHIADVENSWMFEFVDGEKLDMESWKYAFPLRQSLDPPQLTGKPLEHYLEILRETREKVRNRVARFREADATRMFSNDWAKYSLEWVLYHNQQHESHHVGQINLLKRLYELLRT